MKKIFLIPLMTLLSCVMAFAAVHQVGTKDELKAAIDNAQDGDEIQLTADINLGYTADTRINVTKSITINGQGHTLTGAAPRPDSNSSWGTILVNYGGTDDIDVAFVDINIINAYTQSQYVQCVNARQHVASLSFDNVTMDITGSTKANSNPLQLGGSGFEPTVTLNNCRLLGKKNDYAFYTWVPVELHATNTTFSGYCGIYFKNGSRGSVVNAENCNFECPNVHSGKSNAFSCFPLEDDGITINLHNCGMNIEQVGDQNQALLTVNNNSVSRREYPVYITISGDNSHFNTKGGMNKTIQNLWIQGPNPETGKIEIIQGDFPEIVFVLTGGTYSVNPTEDMLYYGSWVKDEETGEYTGNIHIWGPTIPDEYEVKEITMEGVATPLYRVVKKAQEKEAGVMYDLNDFVPVEGEDYGNNPVSSFDLSTGTDMTLNQETTTAGYVEVKDNADTSDPTTVTVGTPTEDQTLVINNGLDVQGNSKVTVLAGSTLEIGEGGINTEKPVNIVIEADEKGAASLLLDPTITVNQTPNLTVRMTAKQIGRDNRGDYYWHRFALPLAAGATWTKEGSLVGTDYPTYVYAWDYTANDWKNIAPTEMEPLQGYTLTLASEHIDGDAADGKLDVLQDVVYTFTGNLIGNTDRALTFNEEGFNFFGNSYTGYMDAKTMLNGLESGNIDGTVYMWCNDPDDEAYQSYVGVSLYKLNKGRGLENWQKEVAPMQTFILRLRGADSAEESVNYAASIWGNPRYGHSTAAPAPRRRVAAISEDTYMEIAVKAANGKGDRVDFTEAANNSDAFESGYDVEKYMNKNGVSLYVTIDGMNYSSVVTDNIEGKALSLKTNNEIAYTISFKNVEGTEYALRDNVTGKVIAIEEGTTYEFAAQPNSTVEGRFEIIGRNNAPTAIENTEVKANVKGIYTIMGQYLGEDFEALPAGVYVVDGVKIVK